MVDSGNHNKGEIGNVLKRTCGFGNMKVTSSNSGKAPHNSSHSEVVLSSSPSSSSSLLLLVVVVIVVSGGGWGRQE